VTEAEPVVSSPSDQRVEELRQLLDEASAVFEASDRPFLQRLWSALHVFRGRWGLVFGGMFAWATGNVAGMDGGHVAAADRVDEQAVLEERPPVATQPAPAAAAEAVPVTEDAVLEQAAAAASASAELDQRERDEALLDSVRTRRERSERELEGDTKRLRFFELLIYSLLVIAAVIALAIATIGAIIILTSPAAGAIVTGVALVPGSGAAILFRLGRTLGQRRAETAAARERNADALESVQARLSVSDQRARDRMIGEYAAALRSK
jgi:hypothetical protein